MPQISVGADVEFFCEDHNGNLVPFTDRLGADKKHPKQINEWNHLSVQEDGISIEVTWDPTNATSFVRNARTATQVFDEWLDNLFHCLRTPVCEVNVEGIPYPTKADVIGCDPDFEAYTLPVCERNKPEITDFKDWRFGSGHLHFGYKGIGCGDDVPPYIAAQLADMTIGVPFRFGCGYAERQRRGFYGLPGIYRPKPYGFEYRTPSNLWMNQIHSGHNMTYCLNQFCSLFDLKIQELKALYKQIDFRVVRAALAPDAEDSAFREWGQMYESVFKHDALAM